MGQYFLDALLVDSARFGVVQALAFGVNLAIGLAFGGWVHREGVREGLRLARIAETQPATSPQP